MSEPCDLLVVHAHLFTMAGQGVGYLQDGALAVRGTELARKLHQSPDLRASPGEVRLDEIAGFVAVATVPVISFKLARQVRPQSGQAQSVIWQTPPVSLHTVDCAYHSRITEPVWCNLRARNARYSEQPWPQTNTTALFESDAMRRRYSWPLHNGRVRCR